MASSSTRKQCANDDGCKQTAVTNCEGCSKAFCIKHFTNHRRLLDEEMNMIIDEHNLLKNSLNQQIIRPDCHAFIQQIDRWEKESIMRIQQRANELRQELLQATNTYANDLSKKLQQLSEKLKESRENGDCMEADLQNWKKILDDLKATFTSPSTISIKRCDNNWLVQNISIGLSQLSNDLFQYVFDNAVNILHDGKIALRDNSRNSTELRGRNEYERGCHTIRLFIEQLTGEWMFFGINSKSIPLQKRSCQSRSAYGWTSANGIWIHGEYRGEKLDPPIEWKTNDKVTLIFDCDSRQICIINERTNTKHGLVVDIDNCPFPWQLHVVLYEPNSRLRILSN